MDTQTAITLIAIWATIPISAIFIGPTVILLGVFALLITILIVGITMI